MGFDQYLERPEELSQETRTFARMITSPIEEAEAISWYEQRNGGREGHGGENHHDQIRRGRNSSIAVMTLEFLLHRNEAWRTERQGILFTKGDIVKRGEAAKKKVD